MPWYGCLAYFFAGVFFANGVPHFVQGVCGNKFQTPFATPRGVGESSAIVNVVWGVFNFLVGCALVGFFLPPLPPPAAAWIAILLGMLVIGLFLASHFGKVRNSAPHP